jgi:hypothetical protein
MLKLPNARLRLRVFNGLPYEDVLKFRSSADPDRHLILAPNQAKLGWKLT